MNHLDFALLESAALAKNPFEIWAEKVKTIVGHDLDGDDGEDGYSLDGAFDAYQSGATVDEYARRVWKATGRCVICGDPKGDGPCAPEFKDICVDCAQNWLAS